MLFPVSLVAPTEEDFQFRLDLMALHVQSS